MSRVSIIGAGYVGLVSGACFAELGHDCVCVDADPGRVDAILRRSAPFHEAGLDALLERHVGTRLHATTDLREAILATDLTIIAVGTPTVDGAIDLGYVEQAARDIGLALRDKDGYHVVVVKSTVVPGTTDGLVRATLEDASGKRAGSDFGVGMNPEFLTEGVAVDDFLQPDRIVIGGSDERAIVAQRSLYEAFRGVPVVETTNTTAEMIKYASNCVLATMISYSNEIADVCTALGEVDAADVMRGVHLSRYFTLQDAAGMRRLAPIAAFLWPGCGYGGSCLPKDTRALSAHAASRGVAMPLMDAVIRTNAGRTDRMMDLLEAALPTIGGRRVAVLGLSFKPDTDDLRESPAFPVIDALLARGARVVAYDPVASEAARPVLESKGVELAPGLSEALAGAEAAMLITAWHAFRGLPEMLSEMTDPPVLVDGRRMIDPAAVPIYRGIGR